MTNGESKIKLSYDSSTRGGTLLPVIKYCLEEGAKLKHRAATAENPFMTDKSGVETCTLISHITINDILKRFSLPEHVTHGKNALWDSKNSVGLDFVTPERHVELSQERAIRKKRREKKRINRKVKLDNMLNDAQIGKFN